jgi:hypothetical protein
MKLWVARLGQNTNHNELTQFILKRIDLPFITVMEQVCARVDAPMQSSNLLNSFYAQAQGKLSVAHFCSIMEDKYDNIKAQLPLSAALVSFVRNISNESYRIKLSRYLQENKISSWFEMRKTIQILKHDYPDDAPTQAAPYQEQPPYKGTIQQEIKQTPADQAPQNQNKSPDPNLNTTIRRVRAYEYQFAQHPRSYQLFTFLHDSNKRCISCGRYHDGDQNCGQQACFVCGKSDHDLQSVLTCPHFKEREKKITSWAANNPKCPQHLKKGHLAAEAQKRLYDKKGTSDDPKIILDNLEFVARNLQQRCQTTAEQHML